MPYKLFLIGLPGSGKTTLGKDIARYLFIDFIDMDEMIVQKEGRSIKDIFDADGETYFRKVEQEVLHDLIRSELNAVISTGGGAPCFFDNMDLMLTNGVTLFLNVPPEELAYRLAKDKARPMVQNKSVKELIEFFKFKMTERFPFYNKARFQLTGSAITSEQVIKILAQESAIS